ncbi:MAG: ASCH domain-containing protein [Achromobacter sp.]|uniref:ASCH domain-containing protein n=1 Tax=Achromobacter TaxID=222 RepID=UPI000681840D|nr:MULTISPECIES: ASCH domain-containing protein [Achromobacter]KNY11215.1 ASCH domain-containing protein [Achromobacter piechaudii]MPS80273.1 ASCH domain-containing protein [Achromobacter sp.]
MKPTTPPPAPFEDAVTFQFGDSPELADALLALVLAGTKTATCGALHHFNDDEPVPQAGRRDVVLDGRGRPACVIETTSILIQRFDQVDEAFAVAEGEGPFPVWRDEHIAYFERNGGYAPDMLLVCERFRVVHIFDRQAS